jgi:hypothetical protein
VFFILESFSYSEQRPSINHRWQICYKVFGNKAVSLHFLLKHFILSSTSLTMRNWNLKNMMKHLINTSKTSIAMKAFLMTAILFFFLSAQSQTIQILRFRNDLTYCPGSSVSVHLKLTGIFDLNNRFILELSDANGSFANPRIISETEDFFIPVINGIIPANVPAGNGYKLRVRATTTNAVIGETAPFKIVSAAALTEPLVRTISPLITERVDCININPVALFGFVNKDNPDRTQPITIQVTNAGTETYTINVLNISTGTLALESIPPLDAQGRFSFPSNLPVGYYTIEIIKSNGTIATVKSFTFLFNTGNTSLGNITNEQVCVNNEVVFTIDPQNIINNYPGSKYTIDYGDGSPREEYTHAQIIANPVLKHTFNIPTCESNNKAINNNNYFFRVDLFLWNKGLTTTGTTSCSTFYKNGNGTTKWINTSKPPVADFTGPTHSCISRPLNLINTSIPGAYGTKQICENDMYTSWYVKKPNMSAFSTIADFEGVGKLDYTIPSSDLNIHGCWEVKLEVRNLGGGCTKVSTKIKTIGIERTPAPNFNVLQNGSPVTQICAGSSVKMQDISNIKNDNCKAATYNWSIVSSTGWQYLNNTNSSTQEPEIKFNTAGTYTITFSITNSCGTQIFSKDLVVAGEPTITGATTQNICTSSPINEVIDFNLAPYRPTYSTGALTPTTYNWTVNGSATPNADWSFQNSTNANSPYPVIKLNSFKTYTIKVAINGNCGSQSSATYTITLKEGAGITNTNLTQSICSGQSFNTFNLTSSLSGTTYSWTAVSNPVGAIPQTPTGTQNGSSITGVLLTNTTTNPATLTYTVKALNNGCESSKDFVVTVNPIPAAPIAPSTVKACVGDPAPVISATALSGNTLKWYPDATTTTPLSSAPTISTGSSLNTSYFVSQLSSTTPACESGRTRIDVIVTALPTPTITTGNSSSCTNPDGKMVFANLLPSTAYTITYDFNGIPVTKSNITSNISGVIELTGLSAGDYLNIRVVVNGCPSTPTPKITISNPSAPTGVTASPNTNLCAGQTLNLSASSTTNGTTFSWTGPGGFTANNAQASIPSITTAGSGDYTLIASLNGCSASPVIVKVTVIEIPDAPNVTTPINLCKDATAPLLTATVTGTNKLLWYTTATGGTGSITPPVINTTSIGSVSYYVSQQTNTTPSCEGPRSKIDVNVYEIPAITGTSADPTNCINPDGSITLNGFKSGSIYRVSYVFNGGVPVESDKSTGGNNFIKIDGLAAGNYTDIKVTLNGCTSNALQFVLKNPAAPKDVKVTSNAPLCSGNPLILSATSTTANATFTWTGPAWGSDQTGASITVPSATVAMSGTYTVVASIAGCNAPGETVNVQITQTPDAPAVITTVNLCKDATAPLLTATPTGTNTLLWYTAATGGTGSTTPPVINSGTIGSASYYVSQVTNTTPVCESPRSKIDVNVYEIPAITGTSADPTNCITPDGSITLNGLKSGSTYRVSYVFNGGAPVESDKSAGGNNFIKIDGLAAGSYTDIKVTLNGCTSNALQFVLKNPAAPKDVKVTSNAPLCSGNPLILSATSTTANATFTWTGPAWGSDQTGASITVPNTTVVMTGTYTVVASIAGCNAPGESVNVQIIQTPDAPIVITPVNYCHKVPASALIATPNTDHVIRWYDVPNGGTPQNSVTPSTQNIGTLTFYASQITNAAPGCEGLRVPVVVNVYEIPVITGNFTNPTNCINPDGTITINGLRPNSNYTVSYVLNGSSPVLSTLASGSNTSVTLINLGAGNYTQITVTLNDCKSNALSFDLKNPNAPAGVSITTNAPVCSGSTVTLNATSTTANATFRWIGPAWTVAQSGASQTLTNAQASMSGDYTVVATIFGCDAPGVIKNIVIYQTPSAPVVTTPVNYCHKVPAVPLSAIPEGSNTLRWYTTASGGTFSTQAPVPNTANLGSYEFFVSQITTNTTPACESERAKIEVFINPIPVITATATPPNSCFVDNGTITIRGLKPGLIYEVQYDMNGVTIQKNQLTADANGDILIIDLPFGSYNNLFVVSKGCPSNMLGPFKLSSPDIPATPTVSNNSPVCPGKDLKLFANSTTLGVTFEWEGPSNFKSTLQNPIIPNVNSSVNGIYYVKAIFNGCESDKNSTEVTIYNEPVVDLGPDLFLRTGTEHRFNPVVSYGPIDIWKWTPISDLNCSTCSNPIATIRKNITYEVTATNEYGCTGKDEINIKVFCENTQVYIPNAFTPGVGNGVKNDVFYVQGKGIMKIKTLRVFNRWGEIVFERLNILPNDPSIGWDGRVRGVIQGPDVYAYVVEVLCDDGTPFSYKGNVTLLK